MLLLQIPQYLVDNELTDDEIADVDTVVYQTVEANLGHCREVAANIDQWREMTKRETILYDTLNR